MRFPCDDAEDHGRCVQSGKRKYTEDQIGIEVKLAKKERGAVLRGYKCHYCKWWHFSSQLRKNGRRKKK